MDWLIYFDYGFLLSAVLTFIYHDRKPWVREKDGHVRPMTLTEWILIKKSDLIKED